MPFFRLSTKSFLFAVSVLCIVFVWPLFTNKSLGTRQSINIRVDQLIHFDQVEGKPTEAHRTWSDVQFCREQFIEQKETRRTLWSKGYKNPCFRRRQRDPKNSYTGEKLQCLPYFFVAGFPKCGTTDLFQRMKLHPEFIPPFSKEIHWITRYRFGSHHRFHNSSLNSGYRTRTLDYGLQMYSKVFSSLANMLERNDSTSNSNAFKITGDFSPSTIWDNDIFVTLPRNKQHRDVPVYTTADFVWEMNPCAKVIVLMRDPVQRLYSDYIFFRGTGKTPADFDEKVRLSVLAYLKCFSVYSVEACIFNATLARISPVRLRVGIYYYYIYDWLKRYPREQFFFLRLEDYGKNISKSMRDVFKFLQMDSDDRDVMQAIEKQSPSNAGPRDTLPMHATTWWILQQFYKPFNKKLSALLDDKRYLFLPTETGQ